MVGFIVAALAVVLVSSTALATPKSHRTSTPVRAHTAIIGGEPAQAGGFPWMAYVLDFRGPLVEQCSGTVVAPNLVLTAAHCAEDLQSGAIDDPTGYSVMTGNVNIEASPPERSVSGVSRVIVCGCFDRHTLVGDVALLELSTPTSVPAIALASPAAGTAGAVIAGWGKTSFAQQSLTQQLQWADTATRPAVACEHDAPPFIPSNEICTIGSFASTGICNGDSGGPLLAPMPSATGGMVQIGVSSHGYGTCSTAIPSVFTRVDGVAAWVREWAQALAPGSPQTAPEPIAPTLAGIALVGSMKVSRSGVALGVVCGGGGGECSGNVTATIAVRWRRVERVNGRIVLSPTRIREVKIADDRFAMASGASVTIRSELSSRIRALLGRLGRQGFDALISGHDTVRRVVRTSFRG